MLFLFVPHASPPRLSVDLPVVSLISRGLTDNHPSSLTTALPDHNAASVLSLAELFIGIVSELPDY
jgi:hypothetical protein